MARYQECDDSKQMLEVGDEAGQLPQPQQKVTQWRRLGLGLAVVGAIGTMVYSQVPQRRASPMESMAQFHKLFSQMRRELADEEPVAYPIGLDLELVVAPEGTDEEPNAMGIKMHYQPSEEVKCQVLVVFNSQKGKAADLAKNFEKAKEAQLDIYETSAGKETAAQFDDMFSVEAGEDDTVTITLHGPPPPPADESEPENPKLDFEVHFGNTIEHIMQKKEKTIAGAIGGVSIKAQTSFLKKVLSVFKLVNIGAGGRKALDELKAIAKFKSKSSIRYRPDVIESDAAACGGGMECMPTVGLVLAQGTAALQQLLKRTVIEQLATLKDTADGLKTVTVQGIGNKMELHVEFENVHITPLIAEILTPPEEQPFFPTG